MMLRHVEMSSLSVRIRITYKAARRYRFDSVKKC